MYQCNGNKQVVRHLVERVLGRQINGEAEAISWSVLLGSKGLPAVVDMLLDSQEYLDNFGYDIVPYQRRRVLPGRDLGNRPTNITLPRYEYHHKSVIASFPPSDAALGLLGQAPQGAPRPEWLDWPDGIPPKRIQKIWYGLIIVGGFEVLRVVGSLALAALGTGGG